MTGEFFRLPLPDDVEHLAFQYLTIHEVCTVRCISRALQQRVSHSLRKYSWSVLHRPHVDVKAHYWLRGVCNANVNAQSISVVRRPQTQ